MQYNFRLLFCMLGCRSWQYIWVQKIFTNGTLAHSACGSIRGTEVLQTLAAFSKLFQTQDPVPSVRRPSDIFQQFLGSRRQRNQYTSSLSHLHQMEVGTLLLRLALCCLMHDANPSNILPLTLTLTMSPFLKPKICQSDALLSNLPIFR